MNLKIQKALGMRMTYLKIVCISSPLEIKNVLHYFVGIGFQEDKNLNSGTL